MIDEIGNDYVDSHKTKKIVDFFFLHRFVMKIGVALLCFFGVMAFYYLVAFLFFDLSYDMIGLAGRFQKDISLRGYFSKGELELGFLRGISVLSLLIAPIILLTL